MLESFNIPRLSKFQADELDSDSLELCDNPSWWKKYPFPISYKFNQRGYRDNEWPTDLENAIWCIGDSATQGIGIPFDQTWPQLLSKKLNVPVITISMNGATNQWMVRKAAELLKEVRPLAVAIQWGSFSINSHDNSDIESLNNSMWAKFYNEIKSPAWAECNTLAEFQNLPATVQTEIRMLHQSARCKTWFKNGKIPTVTSAVDEERIGPVLGISYEENLSIFFSEIKATVNLCERKAVPLIYGTTPGFSDYKNPFLKISITRQQILDQLPGNFWGDVTPIDRARNWHNYGVNTADLYAQRAADLCKKLHISP